MVFITLCRVRSRHLEGAHRPPPRLRYPEGMRVLGEWWLQTPDPEVILITEANSAAPMLAARAAWDDVFDITILPAVRPKKGWRSPVRRWRGSGRVCSRGRCSKRPATREGSGPLLMPKCLAYGEGSDGPRPCQESCQHANPNDGDCGSVWGCVEAGGAPQARSGLMKIVSRPVNGCQKGSEAKTGRGQRIGHTVSSARTKRGGSEMVRKGLFMVVFATATLWLLWPSSRRRRWLRRGG